MSKKSNIHRDFFMAHRVFVTVSRVVPSGQDLGVPILTEVYTCKSCRCLVTRDECQNHLVSCLNRYK